MKENWKVFSSIEKQQQETILLYSGKKESDSMDFFWQLFEESGSINAYLRYKEYEHRYKNIEKNKKHYTKSK